MRKLNNWLLILVVTLTTLAELDAFAGPRLITGSLSLRPNDVTVADLDFTKALPGQVLFDIDYILSRKTGGNNSLVLFVLCAQDRVPNLNDFNSTNAQHNFFSVATSDLNPPTVGSLQVRVGSSDAVRPDPSMPAYCHAQMWIGGQWGVDAATLDFIVPAAQ